MAGLLSGLPPGLRGYQAQRQFDSQEDARGLQQITGLLGVRNALAQEQMRPLQLQQLQMAIDAAKTKQDLIKGITGGQPGLLSGQPGSPGQSGNSPLMGWLGNPEAIARLKLAGIDLTDMYKIQSTPIERKPGSIYEDRTTGARETIPRLPDGMMMRPDGTAGVLPGFANATGAITGAQEGAKAGLDLVQVPMPGGGTQMMTRADAARMLSGGQSQPAPQAQQDPLLSQGFSPQQAQTLRAMDAPGAPAMSLTVPATRRPVGGGFGVSKSDTEKAGDRAMVEGRVKDALDREVKFRNSWGESYGRLQQLDMLEQLMSDPNVASGALAESISGLKGVADSLGINIKGKGAEDVIMAVAGEMALKMRLQGGENLMPGQMSNFEQQLLRSMSPGLAQSKEGRMLLIQVGKAKTERDMKISEMSADYVYKHGKLDSGFDRQVREFARSNPMFAPERIQAMTELAKRLGGRQ